MKHSFKGECCFCLKTDDTLLRCSECNGIFHKDQCGKLPMETEYERADPDDLLRGMSFAGKREVPNYNSAKCGNCLNFSNERRQFVQSVLPEHRERRISLAAEIRSLDRIMEKQEERVASIKETVAASDSMVSQLQSRLREERGWWKRLDPHTRNENVEIAERARELQAYTVEIGQALVYQEFLSTDLYKQQSQLLAVATEELHESERKLQKFSDEMVECETVISRYSGVGRVSGRERGSTTGFYQRTSGRIW